jgi:thymidylate kinase
LFIILEGIDGGGKSTVAEKLVAALEERGYEVDLLHRGVPERNVLEEYQLDVEDYRPGGRRAIVADRWHWGDIVYGELYRGSSYLGGPEGGGFRYVELFLKSRGAVSVLVQNEPDEILRRLQERGEDYLQLKDIDHVLARYRQVASSSPTHVVTTDAPEVDWLMKYAEFWSTAAKDLAPFPTYIGSRTPRVLLVADRRSDPDGPSMTAMRPSPTMHGSGAYLLEALPRALWGEVGICNGNEEEDLHALLDVLAGPPVVALGHEASKALRKAGITEFAAVPHPAKVNRFHHDEKIGYGQLIKDIIGSDRKEYSWPR